MRTVYTVVLLVVLTAALALAAGCGGQEVPPANGVAALDGGTLVQERCASCHRDVNVFYERTYSPEAWELIIDRMIEKGAQLNDEERDIVIEHLAGQE